MNFKDEKLHARSKSSKDKSAITMKGQRSVLGELGDQLGQNDKEIRSGNAVTSDIIDSLGLVLIQSLSRNIMKFMRAIFMTTWATYRAIAGIQGRLLSNLECCLH